MGEAITLAARMEAAAERHLRPGEQAYSIIALARPYFLWEEAGAISVKGLPEPIAVYRPLALATQIGR